MPTCNLVIRVDPVTSYTSMVQSMGRARSHNAKFIVLVSRTGCKEESDKMDKFQRVREGLTNTLCDQMREVMAQLRIREDEEESSDINE